MKLKTTKCFFIISDNVSRENKMEINMSEIWQQKIDEIQKIIDNTEIGKHRRLSQLYSKKDNLEMALLRCLNSV